MHDISKHDTFELLDARAFLNGALLVWSAPKYPKQKQHIFVVLFIALFGFIVKVMIFVVSFQLTHKYQLKPALFTTRSELDFGQVLINKLPFP
jgi:hypothetical protein